MGRLSIFKAFECFFPSIHSSFCQCLYSVEAEDESEGKALIQKREDSILKLREIFDANKTLAFHLEPKTVALRVSMHCNGCARKVEKHIKKIEGVTSIEVDLESKKVVVTGDITAFEVLESVSKIKFAELWFGS
ncbi:Heavy metal-associated isoprenylated plant protein 26 [Apostasia shenzhenica]|uniref:Heavy metal-associated isoprenylated plant protein 26 n=1 Tax=Apostasia shenzhenica TaxID=1088818 RepID=A0A2I0ATN0_9ASPA|nr:Heavy metal-associated isoprenylated plant protein 26 [Apostasia shenzhenica]